MNVTELAFMRYCPEDEGSIFPRNHTIGCHNPHYMHCRTFYEIHFYISHPLDHNDVYNTKYVFLISNLEQF